MLRDLQVENFALIDQLDLSFDAGFSVLTGETGAGKSIIIDALSLLLGSRASSDIIRSGCEQAIIQGNFDTPSEVRARLAEWGIEVEDMLILSREIHQSGRNKCRINGRMVTLSQLAELAPTLVDISGQHDHQQLLRPETHLKTLDSFGDRQYQKSLTEISQLYQERVSCERKLRKLKNEERERHRQMDLLQFQIEEIKQAELAVGEEEELREELGRLSHAEILKKSLFSLYSLLQESDGATPPVLVQLGNISQELTTLAKYDPRLDELKQLVFGSIVQLEEAGRDFRGFAEDYEIDPQRLAVIEDRLALIHRLERKYGDTIGQILDFYHQCVSEYERLKDTSAHYSYLEKRLAELEKTYSQAASDLSEKRVQLAAKLGRLVEGELADLNMARTSFIIEVESQPDNCSEQGIDRVDFKMAANEGEELRSLSKVASGGEMSRVMLALKSVLSQVETFPTMIFDEVDAGIGGQTAQKIAEKLRRLSENTQVLSVTHLPVIASYGHHHYFIEKQVIQGRTLMKVQPLAREQRVGEIARMLGGSTQEAITVKHARELLKKGCAS